MSNFSSLASLKVAKKFVVEGWGNGMGWQSVRAKSCLCDTITQTRYLISGKFLRLKTMSARCALLRTLLIHTFIQQYDTITSA